MYELLQGISTKKTEKHYEHVNDVRKKKNYLRMQNETLTMD